MYSEYVDPRRPRALARVAARARVPWTVVASFVVRPLFTTHSELEQRINHAPSVTLATAEYLYGTSLK